MRIWEFYLIFEILQVFLDEISFLFDDFYSNWPYAIVDRHQIRRAESDLVDHNEMKFVAQSVRL